MATGLLSTTTLPTGFTSPFKRVAMEERIDDALACIAMVTGNTLAEVTAAAIKLGYPAHGPAWTYYSLIAKLVPKLSTYGSVDYQDLLSVSALPDLAILLVNYDPATEIGRHVLWHHVRATEKVPSFHYIIDPAGWIDVKYQMTSDFSHLNLKGAYYIELTQPSYAAVKGK